jgi:tetratricopeptide (TPR) repeat protein
MIGLPAVASRAWLSRCLAELGAFPEASTHGEEAVRIAEAVDHPNSLIVAYLGVGFLSLRQRNLSRAISVLERGLDLCRVFNILLWFPETAAALGCAYACAGRITEALPLLEEAEQRDVAMGTTGGYALRVGYLSEAYLLAGRMQEAAQLAERALDLALAEELGMRPLVANCHLGLGTLHSRTGKVDQAHTDLAAAMALYRAMEMTFWLPQAEAALTQVEGE